MKGEPRPSWTTGRHKWLRTLADGARRKPKGTSEGSVATYCRALGWTSINPPLGHVLTAEGIATLARWDAGDHGVVPRPKPKGFVVTGLSPVQLATRLLDLGESHAMAVYEALHTGLFGTIPEPRNLPAHQLPCQVKIEAPPPVMREGAPTECTAAPPPTCAASRAPTPAPFGMAPSLGLRTMPAGYSACLACSGKGKTGHGWTCQACHGSGRIRRTVEP